MGESMGYNRELAMIEKVSSGPREGYKEVTERNY